MIKCPNCGSTAQVKCIWEDMELYTSEIYREYECECGCHFEVTLEVSNIKILEEN